MPLVDETNENIKLAAPELNPEKQNPKLFLDLITNSNPDQPASKVLVQVEQDRPAEKQTFRALDEQAAIDIDIVEGGDLVLSQRNWPDDDSLIVIGVHNIDRFISALCDAVGIPSAGSR